MSMQLIKDGKVLGNLGEDGKVVEPDGSIMGSEKEEDMLTLPPQRQPEEIEEETEEEEEETEEEEGEEGPSYEELLDMVAEQREQIGNIIQNAQAGAQTTEQDAAVKELRDIAAQIPDTDSESDPLGIARALKALLPRMGDLTSKVTRLDQQAGFNVYEKQLMAERSKPENAKFFEDKRLGPVAERMLKAELQTNSTGNIASIVKGVVKDLKRLGLHSTKEKLQDKQEKVKKLPESTLRKGDGASPSITIKRPKNVKEAGERYAEWRRASAKQRKG